MFRAGVTESRGLIGLIVSPIEALGVGPQRGLSRIVRRKPDSARGIMWGGIRTRCATWGMIALAIGMIAHRTALLVVFTIFVGFYALGDQTVQSGLPFVTFDD